MVAAPLLPPPFVGEIVLPPLLAAALVGEVVLPALLLPALVGDPIQPALLVTAIVIVAAHENPSASEGSKCRSYTGTAPDGEKTSRFIRS